ncbi:hypothetical protein ACFYE9_15800 [Rhizobium leguminosarum]|uniref:Uncharacterized protein n=2 Tax=Rhizobium leguminosarum TaxID=384 RepID=A0A154IS09_RHILE|nr:hypothetical protein [Rhizobium leguminosarum]KZB03293.1 hypothetical protein A4A59_35335 [Rhizobium leguminosarum]
MTTYAHKKIVETIAGIDRAPDDPAAFKEWIRAGKHLAFLQSNAASDETVVSASGPYTFVYSIAVPLEALVSDNLEDLLNWSADPFTSIASYVSGGGRDTMWIERKKDHRGSRALDAGVDLIFCRTFEGWSGPDRTYFEVNQEYTHLSGIHWRPERSAYCRFDDNGDLVDIVSVALREKRDSVSLVTFTWPELEEYLSIAGYALVRMFDFTLLHYGNFGGWGDGTEDVVWISGKFLYRQKVAGNAAYTRGIQIILPRDAKTISGHISARWSGAPTREYAAFIAQDWRHNQVREISTDPAATTNYFEANENDLAFELSPVFFRPEVLSKYKTDREKYTVADREIQCRTAWTLRAYDVNDAGQVFAYIVYLRSLPYAEQLHWKSYNEAPKAPISERAFVNDFKGEFVSFIHPRAEMLSIIRSWRDKDFGWWTLRDEELLDRANPPISSSKDEWADAIMDISKLVVEGFVVKSLRAALDTLANTYSANDGSIALLEKIAAAKNPVEGPLKLEGLRTVQFIRSKVKGHAGGSEGKTIAQDALAKHGTYADHFKYLCTLVVDDLRRIEAAFGAQS